MDAELAASKGRIGAQRTTEMQQMSSFLASMLAALNQKVLPLVTEASVQANSKLSDDVDSQQVSMNALKQDLGSQARSMQNRIDATHEYVERSHAEEAQGMQRLSSQDAAANVATSQLVAALQKSLEMTRARLSAARYQLLQEQSQTDAGTQAYISHSSQQVSDKYMLKTDKAGKTADTQVG